MTMTSENRNLRTRIEKRQNGEQKRQMLYRYNRQLKSAAQRLRREMTPEEKKLWYDFLVRLPVTVNRQKKIGNFIVDFFIAANRVVIELDGIQHANPENQESDTKRDRDLQSLGITVLRFCNAQIKKEFRSVCARILQEIGLKETDLDPPKQIRL